MGIAACNIDHRSAVRHLLSPRHGVPWCLVVVEGQPPCRAFGRGGLMPWRVARALLRSPLTLIYALLCLGLSAIGAGGAYLLLTLGLQTFAVPAMAWLLAGFGLLWACFWLYLLGVVLLAAIADDAE